MRPLHVAVALALLLPLVPAGSAAPPLATASVPGPGWVAWKVQAGPGWTAKVHTDMMSAGEWGAYGVFVIDLAGRPMAQSYAGYVFESAFRTRVESDTAGLELVGNDNFVLASAHSNVTLTCTPCLGQTFYVVGMVGGDAILAQWELHGTGLTVLAQATGTEVLAARAEDFQADADLEQRVGAFEVDESPVSARVLVGELDMDVSDALVGAFSEGGLLHYGLFTQTPAGTRPGCDCLYPREARGPGRYVFEAKEADVMGDILLLVGDVALPA